MDTIFFAFILKLFCLVMVVGANSQCRSLQQVPLFMEISQDFSVGS